MNKLKIGDLVCFNSGGMKHKTLGVVLDFDFSSSAYQSVNSRGHILIMWSVVGKYMPRKAIHDWRRQTIETGEMIWHEFGDWFVEVK